MVFASLAIYVGVVHLAYLAYVPAGGYLAWRFPKTFPTHAAAIGWAIAVVTTPLGCPLTWLQNHLRVRAGQRELPGTFRESYFRELGYHPEYDGLVNAAVAIMVAVSWIVFALRRRSFGGNPFESYPRLHTQHGRHTLGRAYARVAAERERRSDVDASGWHPGTRPPARRASSESAERVAAGSSHD